MSEYAPQSRLPPGQWRALAAVGCLVVLISAVRFDGPTRGYWDTYITVPAMFMAGQPVELHRIDGTPRFEYTLKGRLPDDTYDPAEGSFGISSKDQRIGTAILFGAPFSLFNMAAFRWGYAATWGVVFLFGFVGIRRLVGGFALPLLGALVLVFNPFSLYLDRLNGNLFGLAILAFLFFLVTAPRPHWALIGLVYGLLGGIRNEAIILGPLFLGYLWHRRTDNRGFARDLALFTAAAFVAILPVLLWNRFAYGQMLIHPSQVARLEGFRPTFPHSFLGMEFQFNGLLNIPFLDRIVRTPHFAFPTFMLWPLLTVRVLGLVGAALALIGVGALWRRRRFDTAMLLFWYCIVYLLFAPQENWEELKQTFMALHLFPLAAFVTAGAAWLADGFRDRRRWLTVTAVSFMLAGALLGARLLEFPADDRWYVRFPHAERNDSGLDELPEELRKDWHFFYTAETPGEIARERIDMTRPRPWPQLYRPLVLPGSEVWARIVREPFTREHRTLAIWSYIYE
jgi:hypothetical protein